MSYNFDQKQSIRIQNLHSGISKNTRPTTSNQQPATSERIIYSPISYCFMRFYQSQQYENKKYSYCNVVLRQLHTIIICTYDPNIIQDREMELSYILVRTYHKSQLYNLRNVSFTAGPRSSVYDSKLVY